MVDHNYRNCEIQDCVECQWQIDLGIVMACDECDMPGDQDSDGWHLMEDGRTLCGACILKEKIDD